MADSETPQTSLATRFAGITQRVRSALTPPPRNAATPATGAGAGRPGTAGAKPPSMGKLLRGFLVLLVGVYAWQFLLLFIDASLKQALTKTYPFGTGGILGFLNLYFILLTIGFLGYWWLLRRYDILPGATTSRRTAAAPPTTTTPTAHQTRKERKDANAAVREEARAHKTVTGEYDDIHERMRAQRRRS
jgi:hypothetical protein